MLCEEILPLIEELADGEIPPEEKERAGAHLVECEACRKHYEFLKALPGAVRRVPLPQPLGSYWELLPRKVMARIEKEKASKPTRAWLAPAQLRWLGVLAAGVIAAVLSYEVIQQTEMARPTRMRVDVKQTRPAQEQPREVSEGTMPEGRPGLEPAETGGGATRFEPSAPLVESRAGMESKAESPRGDADQPATKLETATGGKRRASSEPDPSAPVEEPAEPEKAVAVSKLQEAPPRAVPASAPSEPAAANVAVGEPAPAARTEIADKAQSVEGIASTKRQQTSRYGVTLGVVKPSETELEARCRDLRESLSRGAEDDALADTRYRLADCSITLYRMDPTEERRNQAIRDAGAFLEVEPEGERADRIRSDRDRLQKETRQ